MTFAEMRGVWLKAAGAPSVAYLLPSPERSMRRALHGLVRDQVFMALGSGGRGDPHRYFLNPMFAAVLCDEQEYKAMMKAIEEELSPAA
jgi:hypothetical protein